MRTGHLWDDNWTIFETAKEKYGVWPLTVWPCNHSNKLYKILKNQVGDIGESRLGCFRELRDDKSLYGGKFPASIFNPQVGIWIMNCFAPKEGICFDPFAGGGTRAVIAAKHGMDYVGVELRGAEIDNITHICHKNGVSVRIIEGDAVDCVELVGKENLADFLITCPPYWNLEKYNGGPNDLSMLGSYDEFLQALSCVIEGCFKILKPGALSCWVVGLHRDSDGGLLALNHDVGRLHREVGFKMREEIILNNLNTGAILRVGNFDKGNKWLIRTHEYVLVFEKPKERENLK